MTGFEWAMLITAILGTGNALTSGTDIETEEPAEPTGGPSFDPTDFINKLSQQQGPLGSIADIPTLAGPTQAAAQAAAKTPKVKVETPPQIPAPGPEVAAAATAAKPIIPNPVSPAKPPPDIGQVLAAIPDALTAIAPFLGLTDQRVGGSNPAPVAGGSSGGLVGRFARQAGGIDIGQLLAALPGIRG